MRQAAHQVAQKLTSTTLPRNEVRSNTPPPRRGMATGGTGRAPRTSVNWCLAVANGGGPPAAARPGKAGIASAAAAPVMPATKLRRVGLRCDVMMLHYAGLNPSILNPASRSDVGPAGFLQFD